MGSRQKWKMLRTPLIVSLCLLGSATAFSFSPQFCPASVASHGVLQCSLGSRGSLRHGALCLRAQEQDGERGKSMIDEVASKGIWQGGVTGEAKEALARVGWMDGDDGETASMEGTTAAALEYTREDIETLVQRAVADETFADDRSKEMFEDDTRSKLLKELVRREVKADYGVELEDLLNPIKVVSLEKKIFLAEQVLAATTSEEEKAKAEDDIVRFRSELAKERKSIMMDWLKLLFRGQAVVSIVVGGLLATDAMPLVEHVP